MPALHIGTSGYQYDSWRGVLYPGGLPKAAWLGHYASRFSSVELNSTFYGLPDRETVRAWREQVPDDFVFAVKLSRFGTHLKRLRDPERWLDRFHSAIEPLGPTLGPVLVQLPPRWHADAGRLAAFLEAAAAWPGVRYAVEFRDPDWLRRPILAILREHSAALCVHDLIAGHPREVTAGWTYLRFHGPHRSAPYTGSYPARALAGAARRIRRHLAEGRDVFAYFNNDSQGHAVRDAGTLRRYLQGA